jgi:hypothetical protein
MTATCTANRFEDYFGKLRTHFITVEMKQVGHKIRIGSTVRLKANRLKLVKGKYIKKSAGPSRTVLQVFDYRYSDDFDSSTYHTNPHQLHHCSPPLPAKPMVRFIRIAEGIFPLTDFEVLY